MSGTPDEAPERLELSGRMDRHAAEALSLEARRLALRFGIEIRGIRLERPEEGRSA
jgi:hypothetical protein